MWKGIVNRAFTRDEFERYVKSIQPPQGWNPHFIVLHNTSAPTGSQWHHTDGHQRMLNLQDYYKGLGWSGGPHVFVADDLIWAFTPLWLTGTHSPSWNQVSCGVEMVGEYETEPFNSGFGAKVRDNTISALATLSIKYNLDSSSLHLHKDDPKTEHKSCPGRHVDRDQMILAVHNEILRRKSLT